MNTLIVVPLACLALAAGCASSGKMRQVESTGESNQKQLRETDQRLRTLEQSVATLDTQVAQLNNRVYEVRTRSGQKTGMTVVPIIPPQPHKSALAEPSATAQQAAPLLTPHGPVPAQSPAHAAAPAAPQAAASSAQPPHSRVINPAAPPHSFSGASAPASAPAVAEKAQAPKTQAAEAKPAKTTTAEAGKARAGATVGLPPEAASPPPPAVQPMLPPVAAAGGNTNVPVPSVQVSDLALPPEHPGLGLPPLPGDSPTAAAQTKNKGKASAAPAAAPAPASAASAPAAAPAQAREPKSAKGEDAAYKAAVKPAMAGRSAESIKLFQNFLQEYPQGRYAANAEYWIGEGLYAQGKYREALAQFEKVDAQWPRHHKNAAALLKAGMTKSRLGDKAGATEAYKKVLSQFPNSEAAGIIRSRGLVR